MTKQIEKKITSLLQTLGFQNEERQTWSLWRWIKNESTPDQNLKKSNNSIIKPINPWEIASFELAERRSSISIHKLDLILDRKIYAKNLEIWSKRYFGPRTEIEILFGKDGALWCLFEFHRPRSGTRDRRIETINEDLIPFRSIPSGCGGFSIRWISQGSQLSLITSNYFGIGYIPRDFFQLSLRFACDSAFLKKPEIIFGKFNAPSIFEWTTSSHKPVLSVLKQNQSENLLVILDQQLSADRSPVNSSIQRTRDQIIFRTTSAEASKSTIDYTEPEYLLAKIPVEALETRELMPKYYHIDEAISSGRYEDALDELKKIPENLLVTPFFMRRIAILGLSGYSFSDEKIFQAIMTDLSAGEVVHSYATLLAIKHGFYSEILSHLSNLGKLLIKSIPEIEFSRSLEYVLPDLLGDAWLNEDPTRAADCYQRIIETRGEMPRILRKLIHIARHRYQDDYEIGFLNRLAKVERRKTELSRIYFRCAQLKRKSPIGLEDALSLTLKSIQFDRSDYRATIMASELLVDNQKPEEAVQLIDSILKDQNLNLSQEARSLMYWKLGDIWKHSFGRSDLAQARYEQSLQANPRNLDIAISLEKIYRDQSSTEKLSEILELKFNLFYTKNDFRNAQIVFDELSSIYNSIIHKPHRAYELYQKLIENISEYPTEIDRAVAWKGISINWQDLYHQLSSNFSLIPKGETRARYLVKLAEISLEKLNDTRNAQRHLLAALDEGWIDKKNFRVLVELLTIAKDTKTLFKSYELRSHQLEGIEKKRILTEMLEISVDVTDDIKDKIAIDAHLIEPNELEPVLSRFLKYQREERLSDIKHLRNLLLKQDNRLTLNNRRNWLKTLIEIAHALHSADRFALLDELYHQLIAESEEKEEILIDAIKALNESKLHSSLASLTSQLLKLGALPPLDERIIMQIFATNPLEIALYHELKSLQAKDPVIASTHARFAAAIYNKSHDYSDKCESMLRRIGLLVPLSENDFSDLRRFTTNSKNYLEYVEVLKRQIDLEDNKEKRSDLLEELAEIYWKKLKDYGRACMSIISALKIRPNAINLKLDLAHISADAGDTKSERKGLLDFLIDPRCVEDQLAIDSAISRLLKIGENTRVIHRILSSHVEHAIATKQTELAGQLAQILIKHDADSLDVLKAAIQASVAVSNDERTKEFWVRSLGKMAEKMQIRSFLAETRKIFEKGSRRDLLILCFKASFERKVLQTLPPPVKKELQLQYGAIIFDTDSDRELALSIYADVYKQDESDHRVWMPLYFLLVEFGTPLERYQYLNELIAKLEHDPRPLKPFPITIESLRAELRTLEDEISTNRFTETMLPRNFQLKNDGPLGHNKKLGENHIQKENATSSHAEEIASTTEKLEKENSSQMEQNLDYDPVQISDETPAVIMLDKVSGSGLSTAYSEPMLNTTDHSNGAILDIFSDYQQKNPVELKLVSNLQSSASKESTPELFLFNADDLRPESNTTEYGSPSPRSNSEEIPLGFIPGSNLNLQFSESIADRQNAIEENPIFSVEIQLDESRAKVDELEIQQISLDTNLPEQGSIEDIQIEIQEIRSIEIGDASKIISGIDSTDNLNLSVESIPSLIDSENAINQEMSRTHSNSSPSVPPLTSESELKHGFRASDGMETQAIAMIQDSDMKASEQNGARFFQDLEGANDDSTDWRTAVIKGDFNPDLTTRLITQAFASELEKHLAIQSIALVAGNCEKLVDWHWRVWRKPREYGYKISAAERFPQNLKSEVLESSQLKLITSMSGLLVQLNRDNFTTKSIAKKLDLKPSAIEKLQKPLEWTTGFLSDVGLNLLLQRISSKKFRAFNLGGLGKEIFFDGSTRSFYLDESYYRKVPNSHLFHRLSTIMWSIYNKYYVPLSLHPIEQFLPILEEIHENFSASGFKLLKSKLSGRNKLAQILSSTDQKEIRSLYEKTGMISRDKLIQTWDAMQLHLHKLQLAETLDIVGVFESLLDIDLLKPGALKYGDIYKRLPLSRQLLEFITKIKI